MSAPVPAPALPWGRGMRQPDGFSCGAASVVVARMLHDPAYAGHAGAHFADEVRATHRRVTGVHPDPGTTQPPWPRLLGTPPWAVASALTRPGTPYATRVLRLSPGSAWDDALGAVRDDLPVGLLVGDWLLPRHVVLAVTADGDDLGCYDPARGRVVRVDRRAFGGGWLPFGRWVLPWSMSLPA